MAARAVCRWVSPAIRGLRASAATGSPGTFRRAPVSRTAITVSAAARARSTTQATATAADEVRGHASAVCPWARSVMNTSPNGATVPPVHAAAIRAAAQISAASAASPQHVTSTAHPAAVPPGASDGRGPRARLMRRA